MCHSIAMLKVWILQTLPIASELDGIVEDETEMKGSATSFGETIHGSVHAARGMVFQPPLT